MTSLYAQNSVLETPACDLCGSTDRRTVKAACRDRLCGLPGEFDVAECTQCTHWYLCPRPTTTAIGAYYATNYYTHRTVNVGNRSLSSRAVAIVKRVVKLPLAMQQGDAVEDWSPRGSGRLLDVGCGNGAFMAKMRRRGWNVAGLDLDAAAVEVARALVPGALVYCGAIEDANLPQGRFALIMISHVLEHMYSPSDFLRVARTLLEPGGSLVVRVPNAQSLEARVFGRLWSGLDAPRHLHHFRPSTLSAIVEKQGFRVLAIRKQVLGFSMGHSLLLAFENVTRSRTDPWGPTANAIYIICYFPAMLLALMGTACSIEMIAEPVTSSA